MAFVRPLFGVHAGKEIEMPYHLALDAVTNGVAVWANDTTSVRQRGAGGSTIGVEKTAEPAPVAPDGSQDTPGAPQEAPAAAPKKRGRPRKNA